MRHPASAAGPLIFRLRLSTWKGGDRKRIIWKVSKSLMGEKKTSSRPFITHIHTQEGKGGFHGLGDLFEKSLISHSAQQLNHHTRVHKSDCHLKHFWSQQMWSTGTWQWNAFKKQDGGWFKVWALRSFQMKRDPGSHRKCSSWTTWLSAHTLIFSRLNYSPE